jgi:DNA modification methylase
VTWEVREGDSLELLRAMPAESVHCVVTSPPYWGLRDYGVAGQMGLERDPNDYLEKMVEWGREIWRVLRSDGTLWLNMGDCYNAYNGNSGPGSGIDGPASRRNANRPRLETGYGLTAATLKPKDLVGMPWRLALALQADGWWNRGDIIWHKPNPMPESVTDRPTRAHEYLFLMTRSERYFYDADAVREPQVTDYNGDGHHPIPPAGGPRPRGGVSADDYDGRKWQDRSDGRSRPPMTMDDRDYNPLGRNLRSVWTIPTQPYPEAHFATFPEALVEPCIKAGTSEHGCCDGCGAPFRRLVKKKPSTMNIRVRDNAKGIIDQKSGIEGKYRASQDEIASYGPEEMGETETVGWEPTCHCEASETRPCVVLDPFCGSGTTGMVALRRGRGFIGLELNPDYCELARRRISDDCPLFNTPTEDRGPASTALA